jgi:translation initiation factor IF-2
MAGKTQRLSKVASELNVSLTTIVDFLGSKGHAIDSNPNTKIEEEQYDILLKQFADDITLKEKSKQTAVKRERRESISLDDTKPKEETSSNEEEDDIDIEHIKAEIINKEVPVYKASAEIETPVVPEKQAEVPNNDSEGTHQLNVLGKIDLDKLNTKTRPDKKKKEEGSSKKVVAETVIKEDPKPEKTTKVSAPEKTPEIAKPEVKEEIKVVESEPEKIVTPEIETIRVETKKITGPTILGKIELPVEKQKVASSSQAANKANDLKKKRKRIKKGPENTTNSPKADGTNSNQNRANNNHNPHHKNAGGNRFTPAPKHAPASEQDIAKEIKDTLARLSTKGSKSKGSKLRREKRANIAHRMEQEQLEAELQEKILQLTEFVTVSELASMMDIQPTKVISACMSLGIFVSINQRLDAETIQVVAEEFGYETNFVAAELTENLPLVEDKEEDLVSRPPIITVMGHVDHGKTSLLDRIRNADVTKGEAGGITQHIGAYSLTLDSGRKLTFLDTPGHEAFTAMRARGAQITDVAIILVAADDDVMPQTKEAIAHAQAANVPMIFAINKIDKEGANPDRIREQLSAMNILVEEWGGPYQCQEISAKKGINIRELLDKVLLEADILELKANPNKNAIGTVIESSLDKGKGYVTNLLVEGGTMHVGDTVLVGRYFGRVRAMVDEKGQKVKSASPATPVSILGIGGAPSAGEKFYVLDDEKEARTIAAKREQLYREQGLRTSKHITLDEIGRRLAIGDFKELNLIVKGDVDGSIEALSDSLLNLSTEEIAVRIVHKGVGAISEADVNLASASDAIIIGFQVRPTPPARKLADDENIDIRLYSVIYKAIEEIKSAMEGMLSPDIQEQITGSAEVRETFNITKVGTIAGCFVLDGVIKRASKVRIIRDGIVVHTGTLGSLKRFKDDQKEVKRGFECGLNIDKYNNIEVGDIVEAFEEVEVARKL